MLLSVDNELLLSVTKDMVKELKTLSEKFESPAISIINGLCDIFAASWEGTPSQESTRKPFRL